MKYSVIIPVFNRPDEVEELLSSLAAQNNKDFELIIVEDGSTDKCLDVVDKYREEIPIEYFYKENSGPGDSRNYGIERAQGEYIVLFDSDCVIPEDYFVKVTTFLSKKPLDCYGGPDAADTSFSDVQKAINHAMTSFLTTGGIRGQEKQLDNFQPRSFNMGLKEKFIKMLEGLVQYILGKTPI